MKGLLAVVVLGLAVFTGCGGSSSKSPANTGALAGNWQFTLQMTKAPHTTTLLSGFLQQTGKAVTGALELTPPISAPPCGGSFSTTGTFDGQNLALIVNEGGATLSLIGTSSASAMGGTYSLVASGCGKDDSGTFTAALIKPLNGTLQGVLHSTDSGGRSLRGADFAVVGQIVQGDNVGATTTSITGTLTAVGYPCFTDASLSGTVSGTFIRMDIVGPSGAVIGHLGNSGAGQPVVSVRADGSGFFGFGGSSSGISPYGVSNSSTCFVDPNTSADSTDVGNVCIDVGAASNCKQNVVFSMNPLNFNPVQAGLGSATQAVTLTNQSANSIDLTGFGKITGGLGPTPEYSADVTACGTTLAAGANCPISIIFTPEAACPPFKTDLPQSTPLTCPQPRTASLPLTVPNDPDSPHALLLSGLGFDAVNPDGAEHNFGVVPAHTISAPSTVTFVNSGTASVTISGVFTGGLDINGNFVPCDPAMQPLCKFVTASQVRTGTCQPASLTDSCTGQQLSPKASCKVDVVYCPPVGTGVSTDTLYLEIVTDEHKQDNTPTLDATRVVVQVDGKSQ